MIDWGTISVVPPKLGISMDKIERFREEIVLLRLFSSEFGWSMDILAFIARGNRELLEKLGIKFGTSN